MKHQTQQDRCFFNGIKNMPATYHNNKVLFMKIFELRPILAKFANMHTQVYTADIRKGREKEYISNCEGRALQILFDKCLHL